jgi:hypothetical protein
MENNKIKALTPWEFLIAYLRGQETTVVPKKEEAKSLNLLGLLWSSIVFIWFPVILYHFYIRFKTGNNYDEQKILQILVAMVMFYYMYYIVGILFWIYGYTPIAVIQHLLGLCIIGFLSVAGYLLYFIHDDGQWMTLFRKAEPPAAGRRKRNH